MDRDKGGTHRVCARGEDGGQKGEHGGPDVRDIAHPLTLSSGHHVSLRSTTTTGIAQGRWYGLTSVRDIRLPFGN